MSAGQDAILVLGLGNRLLGDDAVGSAVLERLAATPAATAPTRLVDGGTVGLALLPALEGAAALIAVDAARMGLPPGSVQVFEGAALDAMVCGRKASAHELALGDLLGAAALRGHLPARRALVAVQPASVTLGLSLSEPVQAALPELCQQVQALLQRWAPQTPQEHADEPDPAGG